MQACIHSIYPGTEGEGALVGQARVFIRFQGCAVGCANCDSMGTWAFDDRPPTPLDEAVERAESCSRGVRMASVTGGDPLHPRNAPAAVELMGRLKARGWWLNLEASGVRVAPEAFDLADLVSFDVKTPSTGVPFRRGPLEELARGWPGRFQVKSVVEDRGDFDFVLRLREDLALGGGAGGGAGDGGPGGFPWTLTPSWRPGEEPPVERMRTVVALNEEAGGPFRVVCQQHKFLHGPDAGGV